MLKTVFIWLRLICAWLKVFKKINNFQRRYGVLLSEGFSLTKCLYHTTNNLHLFRIVIINLYIQQLAGVCTASYQADMQHLLAYDDGFKLVGLYAYSIYSTTDATRS